MGQTSTFNRIRLLLGTLLLLTGLQCGAGGSSGGSSETGTAASTGSEGLFVHVGSGSGRVELLAISDGGSIETKTGLLGPRGVAVLGNRRVVVTTNWIGLGIIGPIHELKIETFDPDRFVFLKTVCATSDPNEFIMADQGTDRIIRMRLGRDGSLEEQWSRKTGPSPRGLKTDGNGQIWVACKNGNRGTLEGRSGFVKLHSESDGAELLTFEMPFGCRGIAIDPDGMAWVACFGDQLGTGDPRTGNLSIVVGLDPFGHFVPVTVGRGPFGIACDIDGNKIVACSVENALYKIDRDGIVVRDSGWPVRFDEIPTLVGGACTTVSIDGLGRAWVEFKLSAAIAVLDVSSGEIVRLIPSAAVDRGEALGDSTGYHAAMVLFPGGDFDRDGIANLDELLGGENPFSRRR